MFQAAVAVICIFVLKILKLPAASKKELTQNALNERARFVDLSLDLKGLQITRS